MSMNLVTVLYLVSAICFIQALKGLSHPNTSRRGNLFGMLGMGLAVITTIGLVYKLAALSNTSAGIGYIVIGLLVGGTAGSIMAKRVEMTKRSEERRVGKECRCRWSPRHEKKRTELPRGGGRRALRIDSVRGGGRRPRAGSAVRRCAGAG